MGRPAAAGDHGSWRVHDPTFHAGRRLVIVHLDANDVEALGAQVILANTYHLMMRPGLMSSKRSVASTAWPTGAVTSHRFGRYRSSPSAPNVGRGATKSTYDGSTHLPPRRGGRCRADRCRASRWCSMSARRRSPTSASSAVRSSAPASGRNRSGAFLDLDAARRQCQFGIVQGGTDERANSPLAR